MAPPTFLCLKCRQHTHTSACSDPTAGPCNQPELQPAQAYDQSLVGLPQPCRACSGPIEVVANKMIAKKPKTAITPEQFDALLAEIPEDFQLLIMVGAPS